MSDHYYDAQIYSNFVGTVKIGKQRCVLADMAYKLAKDGFTKNKRIVLCSDEYLFYFSDIPPYVYKKMKKKVKLKEKLNEFFKQWHQEIIEQIVDFIEQTALFQAKQASIRRVTFDPAFLKQGEKQSTKKLKEVIKFDKSLDAENVDDDQTGPQQSPRKDESPPDFALEEEAYKPQISIQVQPHTSSAKAEKTYNFNNEYEDNLSSSPMDKNLNFLYFKQRLSYNEENEKDIFPPLEKKKTKEIKVKKKRIPESNAILHCFDAFDKHFERIGKFYNSLDFLLIFIENLDKLKLAAKNIKYLPQLTQFTYADQVKLIKGKKTIFGILQLTENMLLFYDYIPENWTANSLHLLRKNPIYQFKLSNILQYHYSKNGIELKLLKSSINEIESKKDYYYNAFQEASSYHSIKYGTSLKLFESQFSISHQKKSTIKKLIFLNTEYEMPTQIFQLIDCFAEWQQLPKLYILVQYLLSASEVPTKKKKIINFMMKNLKKIKEKISSFENYNQQEQLLLHRQIQNKIDKFEYLKAQIEAMRNFYEIQIK